MSGQTAVRMTAQESKSLRLLESEKRVLGQVAAGVPFSDVLAVKYGALSNETGCMRIDGKRSKDVYSMIWRESGGPSVAGASWLRDGDGSPEHRRTTRGRN
jgi:hypothetical protein